MKFLKFFLGLACSYGLAGCNMVISEDPWLVTSNESPILKPGIWATFDSEDCEIDPDTSVKLWPNCAEVTVITDDGTWLSQKEDSDEWESIAPILGFDDPVIGQIELPKDVATSESGKPLYFYFALQPEERDDAGLITATRSWLVLCGPVGKDAKNGMKVTTTPFTGLTVNEENCEAEDIEALRNAATLSAELQNGGNFARWIREADENLTESVPTPGSQSGP